MPLKQAAGLLTATKDKLETITAMDNFTAFCSMLDKTTSNYQSVCPSHANAFRFRISSVYGIFHKYDLDRDSSQFQPISASSYLLEVL